MSFYINLRKPLTFIYILLFFLTPIFSQAQLRADFVVDRPGGCAPLLSSFTNTTTGASPNALFAWDFGNGNTSALQNPGAVYEEEKTYTITLTVTDGTRQSIATKNVTVYKKPTPDFTVSSVLGCAPFAVTFTGKADAGSSPITTYAWDYGDGQTQFTASGTSLHTYNVEQLATVSLTVTDNNGCHSTIHKKNLVEIKPTLTAAFESDKRVLCVETDPVQFLNYSNGPGTLTYVWDFGDGKSSTDTEPSYRFNKKGTYSVQLTVNNSFGCTSVKRETEFLNVANYSTDFEQPALVCEGSNASFISKSFPAPNTFVWETEGNAFHYYYNNFTYYYHTSGTKTVRLINSFGNCLDTMTKQVTVQKVPDLKGFVKEIEPYCSTPIKVQFKDTTASVVKWDWTFNYDNFNPAIRSSLQNPSFTYQFNGLHGIWLTVTNAEGCSRTITEPIHLPSNEADIYVNLSGTGEKATCNQLIARFYANSHVPIKHYLWDFGDGTSSADPTPQHLYNKPGRYTVILKYTLENGCSLTKSYHYPIEVKARENIDFSAEKTDICGNSTVKLRSTYPANYTVWDLGDGSIRAGAGDIEYEYQQKGVYPITMIATNGYCIDTVVKNNYLKVFPPFVQVDGVQNTCEGNRGDVTFTQSSREATSVKWTFSDGTSRITPGDQATITKNFNTGTHNAILTAMNNGCEVSRTVMVYVLRKQNPVLTLGSTELCAEHATSIAVSGYEVNPAAQNDWMHYYVQLEYGEGKPFTGQLGYDSYSWKNNFRGSIQNLDKNADKIRMVTTSNNFGCSDTTNYVNIRVNNSVAGYKIISDDLCFNETVVFEDTSSSSRGNEILTRTWNFGDGSSATYTTGGRVSHVYTEPGNYYVRLSITDKLGCVSTNNWTARNINVKGPKAAFYPSGTNVHFKTPITFYNQSNTYGSLRTSYEWNFGDGDVSTEYSPTHTYSKAGVYTVTLKVSDPETKCQSTISRQVTMLDFNAAFSMYSSFITNNGCAPAIVNFNNTSINARSVSWDFGDGITAGNLNYASHIYEKPGKYIVTLTVIGYNNLQEKFIDSVIIRSSSASILSEGSEACIGQQVKLVAGGNLIDRYTWDFGDGTVVPGTDSISNHRYNSAGVFTPKLIVFDRNGCPSIITKPIQVRIHPDPVIKISPTQSKICRGSSVTLSTSGAVHYQWASSPSLNSTNTPSPVASPLITTTYMVKASNHIGCSSDASITIPVVQPERISVNSDMDICEGQTAQLQASGTSSYLWINNTAGLSSTGIANPVSRVLATTQYTVTGSDASRCFTDTASVTVRVHPVPLVNAGADVVALSGTAVQLSASGSANITRWNWTPSTALSCVNCSDPISKATATTEYMATATTAQGCSASDIVLVKMQCEESRVYIPNAFTPNGDGKNDVFTLRGIPNVKRLLVYNRWGQKVFENSNFDPSDPGACWQGTINGVPAPTGNYTYYFDLQCATGGSFIKKGNIVLIR